MRLLLALLQLITRLAAPVAAFFWAKEKAKKERTQDELEQAKYDAQAWADAPSDYVEFDSRLHALANKIRKDDAKI